MFYSNSTTLANGFNLKFIFQQAKYASHINADAIMTLPELYFKPKTSEQLVDYLELVSQAAPSLPLIYYHFPMMSGVDCEYQFAF